MPDAPAQPQLQREAVLTALTAYVLWGVFPVYFKLVQSVPPTEVLVHRIV